MRRLATTSPFAAPLAAPLAALLLLAGPPSATPGRGQAGGDPLEAAGWRRGAWPGVPAARFGAPVGSGVDAAVEALAPSPCG
jgi:hypothetical protein